MQIRKNKESWYTYLTPNWINNLQGRHPSQILFLYKMKVPIQTIKGTLQKKRKYIPNKYQYHSTTMSFFNFILPEEFFTKSFSTSSSQFVSPDLDPELDDTTDSSSSGSTACGTCSVTAFSNAVRCSCWRLCFLDILFSSCWESFLPASFNSCRNLALIRYLK